MPEPILIDSVPCPLDRVRRTRADWKAAILATLRPRDTDQGRPRMIRVCDSSRIVDLAVQGAVQALAKAGRVVIVKRPARVMRYGVPKTMLVDYAALPAGVEKPAGE